MLISMTGFGRATREVSNGQLIAEIQSVNRKYPEIFISIPKEFARFEQDVRSWVQNKIARGQVSVRIFFLNNNHVSIPDSSSLKKQKIAWEKVAKSLGYSPKAIDLEFLMKYSTFHKEVQFAEEKDFASIKSCLMEALKNLCFMKEKEGKAMTADIRKRLLLLKKFLKSIESLAPASARNLKETIVQKLSTIIDSEALAREAILFADRMDISEEIARLKSHFVQFQSMLQEKKGPVGRKMDFMVQEMGREINTIGAKSADAKIAHHVVAMKSELEKIREQIQNIE